jgi:hypothetical protein
MKRGATNDLVAAYLTRAAGLWAVYGARAAEWDEIGVVRNVGLRNVKLARRDGGAEIAVVFWCSSKTDATAVAAAARATGKPAAEAIPEAAAALNIAVAPAAAIEARIAATARMLRASIDAMSRRGDLRVVNLAYKRLRVVRMAAGVRPISYSSYRERITVAMFLRAMHAAGPEAQRRVAQLREQLMAGLDGRTP